MMAERRFYVRGTNDSHVYDRKVPLLGERAGRSFCQTCLIVHAAPVGTSWHIETSPDALEGGVDRMACGMVIDLNEGDVRTNRPKNVCVGCIEVAGDEEEKET